MRASMVAAAIAALRCTFLNLRSKYRQLFLQFFAAAVPAASALTRSAGEVFQKLIYLAALTAFILINRHKKFPILDTRFSSSIQHRASHNKTNIQKNPLNSLSSVLKESIKIKADTLLIKGNILFSTTDTDNWQEFCFTSTGLNPTLIRIYQVNRDKGTRFC